jgi:hypothetical protein
LDYLQHGEARGFQIFGVYLVGRLLTGHLSWKLGTTYQFEPPMEEPTLLFL